MERGLIRSRTAEGRSRAEAIPEYETVLALDRNWVSAHAHLGQCKLLTGSIEETIPSQERVIRLNPRDPQIAIYFGRIGLVHLLESRIDEAIFWLEKAPEPGHPLAAP